MAIKSQGRRDGKQPNISLEYLRFSTFEAVQAPRISLRCDPWFQAKRYQRHRAEAAEPRIWIGATRVAIHIAIENITRGPAKF
jgi:hypothetical protein